MDMDKRRRTWAWRAGTGIGIAAAALMIGAVATVPAAAAPPSGFIGASLAGTLTLGADGSPGKAFPIFLFGSNTVNPKIVIDLTDVDDIVNATVPDDLDCVQGTGSLTCPLPDGEIEGVLPLGLQARSGTASGDSGTLRVTVSADNAPASTVEGEVKLADGVDLIALSNALDGPEVEAEPGDAVQVPVSAANVGNRTAEGLVITFHVQHGLVPASYSNCQYVEQRLATIVTCTVDITLEPNFAVLFQDFEATVAPDGFGFPTLSYLVEAEGESSPLPVAMRSAAKSRGGTKAFGAGTVKPVGDGPSVNRVADIDLSDNFGGSIFHIDNELDLAAVGATATGAAGATVKVAVGVKNVGKGSIITFRSGGEPAAFFEFDVPPGTEVVEVPANCAGEVSDGNFEDGLAGRPKYQCRSGEAILAGESYTVEFGLKITAVTSSATGKVTFLRFELPDVDAANDTADVVVTVSSGGGLPITGTQTALFAAGGATMLVAGAALYLTARRRRVLLVTPSE
jgi:LPXTG-motif cell wall-anchored protein